MKIHKIMDGPFYREDEDDPWEMLVYAEVSDGNFQTVSMMTYDIDSLMEITRHMQKPTIEPYVLQEEDDN